MRNIANPTEFRANISNKLNAIIDDDTLCVNVERGVFNYSLKEASSKKIIKKWENPRFVQIYLDRLRSIYINLKDTSFLNRIKNGEVTPLNIASMTHQEIPTEKTRRSWMTAATLRAMTTEIQVTMTISIFFSQCRKAINLKI